jgi:Condensation domain
MLDSIPKQRLFEKLVAENCVADRRAEQGIALRPVNSRVPLSLAQEQVWLRSLRAAKERLFYNETITIHGNGPLDMAILEQSFAEIVRRHEAWRTSYAEQDGIAVQVVGPPPDAIVIPVMDLRGVPVERREEYATNLVSEKTEEPLDLKHGPLLRAMLLKFDDARYRFVVIAHQGVVDGVSAYQIFPAELSALYGALQTRRASPLPELPIQFGDFSIWQRARLSGDAQAEQSDYWKKHLAPPLTELRWPKQDSRPRAETCAGAILPFVVPRAVFEAAAYLARSEGATLFALLLTAFAFLMHRYTRQEDIVIGTLSPTGRKRSECEKLLGYFLNPVALRFDFSAKPAFRELLWQTRRIVAEAISHDDIPFEALEQELGLQRGAASFLRVAISLQPKSPALENGWRTTTMDARRSGSRWDFYLAFIQQDGELVGRAQFNPELLDAADVVAAIEELFWLLQAAAEDSSPRVPDPFQQRARLS